MRNQELQALLANKDIQLERTMTKYPSPFPWRPVYAARVFPSKVKLLPLRPNLHEKVLTGTEELTAVLEKYDAILRDENLQNHFRSHTRKTG